MKGIICYYSGTGNTALACRYIAEHVKNAELSVFDIINDGKPDLSAFDLVGFAAFADFLSPSQLFIEFIEGLPAQDGKPAFVLNTFGMSSGKTLSILQGEVSRRGFTVVTGHSLHMPENFPPMIARGLGNAKAPSDKELDAFKKFVAGLDEIALRLSKGEDVSARKVDIGTANKLMPGYPKGMAKRMMGEKFVDEDLCTGCGTCGNVCPNSAIKMAGRPVFDDGKCTACWACYNQCLAQAIGTRKYKGKPQYLGPSAALTEKFR